MNTVREIQYEIVDGGIEDDEGFFWDSMLDYLANLIGFCGCGAPDVALGYVVDGLKLIQEPFDRPEQFLPQSYWSDLQARRADHFGANGSDYLFYYFCDFHELTEHGGSVPGWLSDKGKRFLLLAQEALAEDNE